MGYYYIVIEGCGFQLYNKTYKKNIATQLSLIKKKQWNLRFLFGTSRLKYTLQLILGKIPFSSDNQYNNIASINLGESETKNTVLTELNLHFLRFTSISFLQEKECVFNI